MRYIKFRSEKNTHSLWQKMDGHILIHVVKLVFTTKRGGENNWSMWRECVCCEDHSQTRRAWHWSGRCMLTKSQLIILSLVSYENYFLAKHRYLSRKKERKKLKRISQRKLSIMVASCSVESLRMKRVKNLKNAYLMNKRTVMVWVSITVDHWQSVFCNSLSW